MRQISVDLLGLIAAQLYKDALTAEENQAWLSQFAATDGELRQHVLQLNPVHTLAVLFTDCFKEVCALSSSVLPQ